MGNNVKVKEPGVMTTGKFLAWNTRGISCSVQAVLLSFITIYCTNALGLNVAAVGAVLAATKLVDGFTDLIAGFLVDKTKTKLGKGRPYELAVIGLWIATYALFAIPQEFSTTMKYVWIFVAYTMAQSVFNTLLNANGTAYMVRAFASENAFVKLQSVGGLVTVFAVMIFNMVFPIFEAQILNSAKGWSSLILKIAIPMAILGLMRFIFVKEEVNVDVEHSTEPLKLKDVVMILKNNRYIYSVAALGLIASIGGSINVGNYYFIYVVGNVGIAGVMSIFSIVAMATMLLYPILMKKWSIKQLIQYFAILAVPGGIILFFSGKNLAMMAVGGILCGMATLPATFMSALLVVDCAMYNEYKGMKRMEGTLGSINGFANKIGTAFGTFVLGLMLNAAHFDGGLEVQPDSAILMIRAIYGLVPALFGILNILALAPYNLDKLKEGISAEIMERRARAEQQMKGDSSITE